MSSPGATGLRMPDGMPGLMGAPGRLFPSRDAGPPLDLSRRIGFPTSSNGFPVALGWPGLFVLGILFVEFGRLVVPAP